MWMVRYGMKTLVALRSATLVSSELMGWQDRVGTLEVGKLADITAVEGNPVEDIEKMKSVVFVMKDGAIYTKDSN
jgi:imidazolonepropionase-like amidohydrolase